MKKSITTLLLILLTCIFSSCGDDDDNCDDMLWDFPNYEFSITAYDSQGGKNLLDPRTENNLLNEGVWITYKDKTYRIVDYTWDGQNSGTKATYCPPLALRFYPADYEYTQNRLTLGFGNFRPESNYQNETFTIHWADGTTDEIKFDCYITWNKCDPTIHKAMYLNGEKLPNDPNYSYPHLTFYKEGKQAE